MEFDRKQQNSKWATSVGVSTSFLESLSIDDQQVFSSFFTGFSLFSTKQTHAQACLGWLKYTTICRAGVFRREHTHLHSLKKIKISFYSDHSLIKISNFLKVLLYIMTRFWVCMHLKASLNVTEGAKLRSWGLFRI